jgi:competence protein ComEA
MTTPEERGPDRPQPSGFGKTNLNDATRDDFLAIDGIGEATTARLIDYRDDIGPFRSFKELKNIPTLTPEKIDLLQRHFSV